MLGRIEFISEQFEELVPKKGTRFPKNRLDKIYKWLSKQLGEIDIKHKVIDLDRDLAGKSVNTKYGKTILIVLRTRYQLVCRFFPCADPQRASPGVWGLEIYKERTRFDRLIGVRKLGPKDPLVKVLMEMLAKQGFEKLSWISEKQMPTI
jgi:hypothetical protein